MLQLESVTFRYDVDQNPFVFDLEAGAGEVAPVADVGEAEALHDLVQVLHVLPRHGVDVLAAERVLDEELVELLDLVARGESPGTRRKKTVRAWNVGRGLGKTSFVSLSNQV